MGNEVCCRSRQVPKFDVTKFKVFLQRSDEQLEEAITKQVEKVFLESDDDADGGLSQKEVQKLVSRMEEMGFKFPVSMRSFDFDRNGSIDRNEFRMAMSTALCELPENLWLLLRSCEDVHSLADQAWRSVDSGKFGALRVKDLSEVMKCVCDELGEQHLDVDDIQKEMERYDANQDGALGKDEFEEVYIEFLAKLYYVPRERRQQEPV